MVLESIRALAAKVRKLLVESALLSLNIHILVLLPSSVDLAERTIYSMVDES